MKPVAIKGMGLITPVAGNARELMELAQKLSQEEGSWQSVKGEGSPLEFSLGVPASKVRRAPRLVKMAVAAAHQAIDDAGLLEKSGEDIGTVLATGYGTVESNVTFADSVVDAVPSLASPAVFPYTVPNSCLGQVCIVHGLKGPSTMLMGGDVHEYSSLLLSQEKARYMLCGAVEEASPSLVQSFGVNGVLPADSLEDGAVMLVLGEPEEDRRDYCQLTAFAAGTFPACPYVSELTAAQQREALPMLTEILSEAAAGAEPTMVLRAGNGGYLDQLEEKALAQAFQGQVIGYRTKNFFGESISAGYSENIALGAALIKAAREAGKKSPCILATGIDAHGNYLAARLEA